MPDTKKSLAQLNPKVYDVPLLILLSTAFLIWGIQAPMITWNELVFWKHTFTLITGIESLFQEKYYGLGLIIVFFSIIFPLVKLIALFFLWSVRLSEKKRQLLMRRIETFGKWSMLDVFVVSVTIVISKLSVLAKAQAHMGIYIFCASILLSMFAAMRLAHLTRISSQAQR